MTMIHQLKTEHKYFEDVVSGIKKFEVRNNDRGFEVGDFLALNELSEQPINDAGEHGVTGRCCLVEVSYVLADERFLPAGTVVLGIEPRSIYKAAKVETYSAGARI